MPLPPLSMSQIRVVERVVWKIVALLPSNVRLLRFERCSVPLTLYWPALAKQIVDPLGLASMKLWSDERHVRCCHSRRR